MDHRKLVIFSSLIIVAIILSGCATATPEVIANANPEGLVSLTETPRECPTATPQECPSVVAEPPVMNQWRWGYTKDLANVIITFDPGDKCSMEFLKPPEDKYIAYDIVVNDQAHQNYMVVTLSLDEGKSIEDLEAYHAEDREGSNPPPFSKMDEIVVVSPMSRTFHIAPTDVNKLYFVCLVQGPDDQRVIEEFDGINIPSD